MTSFKVTPEYVATASSDCHITAGNVLTNLEQLRTFVQSLGATWLGVTASQFEELMNNVHVYSVALHDALEDIGEGLKGNYVNYVESEADNLRGLQQIDGNLVNTPTDPSSMGTTPVPPPINL